jgi:hypothetical protein
MGPPGFGLSTPKIGLSSAKSDKVAMWLGGTYRSTSDYLQASVSSL